jgi:hypothetical protein
MSSPQILDLATLLAPIPGDNPAGESLFYNDTYDVTAKKPVIAPVSRKSPPKSGRSSSAV